MECFTKPYYESLKQLYPIITELYFVFKERAEKQGNAALDNENEALNTADRVISTADNEEVCERITELGAHCEHVGFILGFTAFGKPDIAFIGKKVAVFCDSEFWHGYNWEERKHDFKSHQEFWIPKIERNMERDKEVTAALEADGWTVLRFWGRDIKKNLSECAD